LVTKVLLLSVPFSRFRMLLPVLLLVVGMLLPPLFSAIAHHLAILELLAAELLFGLGFVVLLVAAALSYLVGSAGERGLQFAEVGVRLIRDSARHGLSNLEINRKPFRLAGKIVSLDK
jgi:hypothetical protein